LIVDFWRLLLLERSDVGSESFNMILKFPLPLGCPSQVNFICLFTSAFMSMLSSSSVIDALLLVHQSSRWHLSIDNKRMTEITTCRF
jgi:hypothetical protein